MDKKKINYIFPRANPLMKVSELRTSSLAVRLKPLVSSIVIYRYQAWYCGHTISAL